MFGFEDTDEQEYEIVTAYGLNADGDLNVHSATGFCPFDACPCHEDQALIGEVNELYEQGLLTAQEASHTVAGRAF